jgi:hypothetical protein
MCYKPLGNMNTNQGTQQFVRSAGGSFQTMFFKKGANLDAWLPFLEWATGKEGRATLGLGIEGEQWKWNADGFAQLTDEAYAEYEADIAGYNKKYGCYSYFTEITAYDDPETNPFGGGGSNLVLQSNQEEEILRRINGEGTTPDWKYDEGMPLSVLIGKYPNIDTIRPVLDQVWDILTQSYLVNSDDEAKNVLDGYLSTLKKNGLDDLIKWLQEEYDKNPDMWAEYSTEA